MAYCVPKLAFERFPDMGTINRSYNTQQEIDGTVVPWFNFHSTGDISQSEFYKTLGLHVIDKTKLNTDYLEAYNAIWNYIAAERSPSLTPRWEHNEDLAPAFWAHTQMKHVKPTFDAAMMDGQIVSTINGDGDVPVRGISITNYQWPGESDFNANIHAGADDGLGNRHFEIYNENTGGLAIQHQGGIAQIFAELTNNQVLTSIADIDRARETAAWARLRSEYQGLSEEWMIDQMLQGIRIRDESLRYPILLDAAEGVVGMSQRYATDAANLDQSLTDGRTSVTLNLRCPAIETGGVIMIVAQALPEQIYERQLDKYAHAKNPSSLPNRTRDELDVQPVSLVTNGEVDTSHGLPDDLFGYAPLNHEWIRQAPNVGGRYYRPDPAAAWTEDRNRIWDADVSDPTLGPDFYLSTTLSHEVFNTSTQDPFEWWVSGNANIQGLTYFGPPLRESVGDYDAILDKLDDTRLVGDGSDVPTPNATEEDTDE